MKSFNEIRNDHGSEQVQRIDEFFLGAAMAGTILASSCLGFAFGSGKTAAGGGAAGGGAAGGGFWGFLTAMMLMREERRKEEREEERKKNGESGSKEDSGSGSNEGSGSGSGSGSNEGSGSGSKEETKTEVPKVTDDELNKLRDRLAIAQKSADTEKDETKKAELQKQIDNMACAVYDENGKPVTAETFGDHVEKTFSKDDIAKIKDESEKFKKNVTQEDGTEVDVDEIIGKMDPKELEDLRNKQASATQAKVKERQTAVAKAKAETGSGSGEGSGSGSGEGSGSGSDPGEPDPKLDPNDPHVDPSKTWKRRPKQNGEKGLTDAYYNRNGDCITAEQYQERVKNYQEWKKKQGQTTEGYISIAKWLIESMEYKHR